MLDIKFIRENKEAVKKNCEERGVECDIDRLLEMDEMRKRILREVEELHSLKNDINDLIREAKTEEEKKEITDKGKEIKEKLEREESQLKDITKEFKAALGKVPNIHSDDTPIGPDESGNKVLRKFGEPKKFSAKGGSAFGGDFQPKDHIQLGENLGVIDIERAAKVSGSRFNYLKGELALLEYALVQYVFVVLTNEEMLKKIAEKAKLNINTKPFIPVVPPVMIKPEILERMARMEPKEERYYIESDDLYLIGSAEHTLGPLHMDEIINEEALPIRYIGFSTAFRREAGSYGKDTKGILRVHQFDKLEMMSFSAPENSLGEQDFIVAIQEYLMQSLNIPYRVVILCTGDMSAPDYRQIDIESWMPGQNKYRETHTSDYNTDYQSRRLNTKVRRKDGKVELVHTNDATALAIGRTLIAILENFQQADGSVKIPEVLQKYMAGNIGIIKKK